MANLRDLGLSEYEARTYRTLVGTGPIIAKDLSRASDVPMGRIYDVLNELEDRDLVRSQDASRPKTYVAVEPDVALDRLLAEKRRELDERLTRYESVVDTLTAELAADDPVAEEFWTAAVGDEETVALLLDRLAAADDRIVIVAGTPATGVDLPAVSDRVTAAIADALDRGVDTRVLVSAALVDRLPDRIGSGSRSLERLLDDERFESRVVEGSGDRPVEGIEGSCTLLDDTEVCLEVPHPLSAGEPFAMIDLTDPTFAAEVRDRFEPRWAAATRLDRFRSRDEFDGR
ncbi:Sugar-specific transcriptional regulator TrmB [Halopenitus malekzadehii]|uniref:Sugar-specific transcriptional regulator TrmB n=1 Tax=Halopenitus malekzadehii TaxID=1267564 RepID=A0A1H6IPG4_9EURY|nr:helix-turn-helix domain-containing protein [Halopenitus malekzadehii]SEH49375.1 Sugar-specific transcriptional regulator TrmB [Halopenitus malekzadehii]